MNTHSAQQGLLAAQPHQALPSGPLQLPAASDPMHAVWALLENVTDPEIPVVSLREMGILRAVRLAAVQPDAAGNGAVEVVITPTYSGCPAMSQMEDDVRAALTQAGLKGRVVTQLAPAWSTDWMTPAARDKLRAYGIAPPMATRCSTPAGHNVVRFAAARNALGSALEKEPPVPCPQCGSENTTETSHFGSTACKALYRCLNCMEPFDYFKPY